MTDSTPTESVVAAGQRTIWDELVEQQADVSPAGRRFVAGFLSYLALADDTTLIRIGRLARAESAAALKRKRHASSTTWTALVGACADEWLRRHPRPEMRA